MLNLCVTLDISAKNISVFCQKKAREKSISVLKQVLNSFLHMLWRTWSRVAMQGFSPHFPKNLLKCLWHGKNNLHHLNLTIKKKSEFCHFSLQFPTNWEGTCLFTACPVLQACTALQLMATDLLCLKAEPQPTHPSADTPLSSCWHLSSASCTLSPHAFIRLCFLWPCMYHANTLLYPIPWSISFRGLGSRNLSVKRPVPSNWSSLVRTTVLKLFKYFKNN